MSFRTLLLLPALLLLVTLAPADGPAPRSTAKLDFNRDIRPILSDNCFACHGPDAKTRRAKLRLDVRLDHDINSTLIVPGIAENSDLFQRLITTETNKLMPPRKSGKSLKPDQIALLKRWIDEGASFSNHWAYVPPRRPSLPVVKSTAWGRNPIDRFILARLEDESLTPAPEADRVTLLRRVTLDLTGLPPTPTEVDAFLKDTSANAYDKVVDRLLNSTRYGEHMARYWLDLARFGDTHGLHLDNYREMWPYRDWVVNAFNTNKSYDRFVIEQLAGDLLPEGKLPELIATGFCRAHVTTSEGGSITEEIHIRNVNDRVETMGTVFLGLTVGCARCHDHKYDPVTMKDFYSLSAFFNSLEGNPLDGNATRHPPVIKVPSVQQERELAELEKKIALARKNLETRSTTLVYDDKLDKMESEKVKSADFIWIDDKAPNGAQTMTDGRAVAWPFVNNPVNTGGLSLKLTATAMNQHFFTNASPGLKPGAGDKLFAHVYLDPTNPPKEIMLQWYTTNWLHRAYWGQNLIDFGRDASTERRHLGPLPATGKWVRLEVPIAQVGIKPGTPIVGWAFTQHGGTAYWDTAGIHTQMPQSGGTYDTLTQWVRAQKSLKGEGLPAAIQPLINLDRDKRTPAQQKQLSDYFVQTAWSKTQTELAPLRQQLTALEAERTKVEATVPVTYVFKEVPKPIQAYILKRGEYDQRGDPVSRATPGFLPTLTKDATPTRLHLAEWLLSVDNPLPARVAVNRYWQQVFGTGLVKTAEDFGAQGESPSHPELLDWLAVEFRSSGWDVKKMMKLIVTSATYRQSARGSKDSMTRDSGNRLLSRGPRFRLDAETLRDQALAISGLLVEKMGGPSVKPPQPAGLWSAVAYVASNTAKFTADTGTDKVHRRSLYTFWKRTSPPPQMTTFDAPSREACSPRRERTNTPLQALLLLNDIQYIECARELGHRALREGGRSTEERLSYLFQRATCRKPDARELGELSSALRDLLMEYEKDPKSAQKLIAVGETKPDATMKPAELAAWTMLASVVLNLDEVLNK